LLDGTQAYVLAVTEQATRRVRILGVTLHPTGDRSAGPQLMMDLGDQTDRVRFMIRDRDSKFTCAFDAVLADAGIQTALCNIQKPCIERDRRTVDRRMPPRAPGPHPRMEHSPSAADPAPLRNSPQSPPAALLPARRRATNSADGADADG